MADFEQIRNLIRDFVAENLPAEFKSCYWQGERKNAPKKPYCLLTELSDSPDLRTSEHHKPNSLTKVVTEYKSAVITISVYVDGLEDYDEKKVFARRALKNIRTQFETKRTALKFKKYFSINSISGIRPLHETVDGGYQYRYEFDLTLGYNDIYEYDLPVSQKVIMDINEVHMEVTTEDD